MSNILVKYDSTNSNIDVSINNLSPYYADLQMSVLLVSGSLSFKDFSFGYVLIKDGTTVSSNTWPPPGTVYLSTTQELLDTVRLNWDPKSNLTLQVWFSNAGTNAQQTVEISVPDIQEDL